MSINNKVVVTWLTEDEWKGNEHPTKRKYIEPGSREALVSGQSLHEV